MTIAVIGRGRFLLDELSKCIQATVGGPPPSRKVLDTLHRHNSSALSETRFGNTFEVQIVGPDGEPTGHIARVTIEMDRWDEVSTTGAA